MSLQECSHDSDILSFLSQRKVRISDLQLELRLVSFPSDFNIHWLSLNKHPYLLAAARSKVFYFQSFHECKEYSLVLKPFCSLWILSPVQPVGLKLTWRQLLQSWDSGILKDQNSEGRLQVEGTHLIVTYATPAYTAPAERLTWYVRIYIFCSVKQFFALCSARYHRKRYKHETLGTSRVYSATVTFDFFSSLNKI